MFETISPLDAKAMIENDGVLLIDVREKDEFHDHHIPYALNLPLSRLAEDWAKLDFSAHSKIIFHCLKGGRSAKACQYASGLQTMPNTVFYNLEGGITAWADNNLITI